MSPLLHLLLGEAGCLLIAWAMSERRDAILWRTVVGGVLLQLALGALLLKVPLARAPLRLLDHGANALQAASEAGTSFVFGFLGGGPLPFAETQPGAGFVLAFRALPLVLLISALAALLFHWGVLQRIVAAFAWLLRRTLGISGPLALGAAVHVFVGMVEAPLLVRPYLAGMQRGELFALMSCGLAGVAGTVMVIYAGFLHPLIPDALGNILVASVVSTPAALAISAVMVPFGPEEGGEEAELAVSEPASGALDALVRGTAAGVPILIGIIATLIVAVATVALANASLGLLPHWGGEALSLQRIFAWPFRPLMWLIGVPWPESNEAARLMASKTVLNEFVAYRDLAGLPPETFATRTRLIVTYALCGFANFGSLGILVGGLGVMLPERRTEVIQLGLRSVLAGTLATCMSGAVAGALA
ncbi:MAG: nucleoside:proton symporter [Acetobacteraceae bacterium]|nr:nucleoside:proton symporter [Acetobacteraceae bacterium]